MPPNLNTLLNSVRQRLPLYHRDAAPETQNAAAHPLSSSDGRVNNTCRLFRDAVTDYGSGESSYTYGALQRLHQAGRNVEQIFTESAVRHPATTMGDMATAIAQAKARLPVQPSRNRAVLMPLLEEVQERVRRYADRSTATAEISNEFVELHAAVTAYLEALGAQPLHPTRRAAGWLPSSRPKLRTHDDIHEQTLLSIQPDLFTDGRRQTQPSYIRPPRDEGNDLPDYSVLRMPHELPRDLEMRIDRSIRKMSKLTGTAALSDPAPADLLNDLKSLLGSYSINAEERGEMLYRLAKSIPSEEQMGGTEHAKLIRLFLRFLAPDRLPGKYHQTPAAHRAGIGTEHFNPEALVPYETLELITLALINSGQRFGQKGRFICDVLKVAFERSRKTHLVTHARFLRQCMIAIHQFQSSVSRNRILLRDMVSVIVDEIAWLQRHVAANHVDLDMAEQMLDELDLDGTVLFDLGGLTISSVPEWRGRLSDLPAYNQLHQRLEALFETPVTG